VPKTEQGRPRSTSLRLTGRPGVGGERFVSPILQPDGTLAPGTESPLDREGLLEAMTLMVTSRLFDERGVSYQRQGRIGTMGEVRGQEAVSAGSALAIDPNADWVVPAYRELPAMLRQGMSLRQFWLALLGHPQGWAAEADTRLLPIQIELAAQLPHAVGLAWGLKIQSRPGVVLTYFGDGASSEGDFYEAGNLAGLTKAPVVLICQNNSWAISMPRERQTRATTIAAKAAAFGIPGYVVDGNDVMAMYAVTRHAVDQARAGKGPTLIEAQTYRVVAHNTSDDPGRYAPEDDRQQWLARDPLARLKTYLVKAGLWDEERDVGLRTSILGDIDEAFRGAETAAATRTPRMLFDHVYGTAPSRLAQQRAQIEQQEQASAAGD
jgi:pyruvate dehydrogenase E1 component alpha subunit